MSIAAVATANTTNTPTKPSIAQEMRDYKQQSNAQLLAATEATTLSIGDKPQALLLRTAIDRINGLLEAEHGPNALENATQSGLDYSPEATAERIVSLATGFFEAFKQQHLGEEADGVLNLFIEQIEKGVLQGFSEARGILEGLSVLNGGIASNIDETFNLVQQGLDDFRQSNTQENIAEQEA